MDGIISYLLVIYPTDSELEEFIHLELTDSSCNWGIHFLDELFHTASV